MALQISINDIVCLNVPAIALGGKEPLGPVELEVEFELVRKMKLNRVVSVRGIHGSLMTVKVKSKL